MSMESQILKKYFYLDLRSIALLRITTALIFLYDLIGRFIHRKALYTDYGILPRNGIVGSLQLDWKLSLFHLDGSLSFATAIMLMGFIAGVCYLLGIRTKLAGLISWIVICSLHSRNPNITHGGDNMLRMLFFWSMFLPVNARWSLDALRSNLNLKENTFVSAATFAVFVQALCVYIFTSLYKIHPDWTQNFSAFYYAIHLDVFTTHLGNFFRDHLGFLHEPLTLSAILLELFGVFLLFIPFQSHRFRLLAVILFTSFHFGIWVTLNVGVFAPACMAMWLTFIPKETWDSITATNFFAKVSSRLSGFFNQTRLNYLENFVAFSPVTFAMGAFKETILILSTVLVVAWNIEGVNPKFDIRSPFTEYVFFLQLNQGWNMFAPSPMKNDGWYVFEGDMPDGSKYDIFYDRPVSYAKPEHVSDTYINAQWQKWLLNMNSSEHEKYIIYFAKYLCRNWNDKHTNKVNRFRIFFVRERTPPPGEPFPEVTTNLIWEHFCFGK